MKKVSIIGCGNMGRAILEGIVDSGKFGKDSVLVYDKDKTRLEKIGEKYPVHICLGIKDALVSEYILLAVKPQDLKNLIMDLIKNSFKDKTIISFVAGASTAFFESRLGKIGIIRIMPNTPALVKRGVFAISGGKYIQDADMIFAEELLYDLGKVVIVDEKYQNLVTALSGSGPAYFFLFCKYLIEAAVKKGLDRETAKILAVETMAGSAELIKVSGKDLEELVEMVASPGGTTEKALAEFKKRSFSEMMQAAVESASNRAFELEKMLD